MPTSMFTDAYKALVEALVQARKQAGVSQAELGQRLGKGQKFVSVIETGVRRVDLIEFTAIAQALGYDPVELYAEVVAVLPERVEI
jgi:transcriptional regulator with XRE-family HTH domain